MSLFGSPFRDFSDVSAARESRLFTRASMEKQKRKARLYILSAFDGCCFACGDTCCTKAVMTEGEARRQADVAGARVEAERFRVRAVGPGCTAVCFSSFFSRVAVGSCARGRCLADAAVEASSTPFLYAVPLSPLPYFLHASN